jgi:hypothetical protein
VSFEIAAFLPLEIGTCKRGRFIVTNFAVASREACAFTTNERRRDYD